MAAPTTAEIQAGRGIATGAISFGPLGTTLPTDVSTALNAAIKGLGYVGAAGIVPTRTVGTDDIKDMNGDTVYTVQNDFVRQYQVELLQTTNVDVAKMIFGTANVTETAANGTHGKQLAVLDKGDVSPHGVLVIETFDALKKHRETAADAQPVSVEVGPLVGTGIRSYTVTFKIFRDSTGVFLRSYDDDGVITA